MDKILVRLVLMVVILVSLIGAQPALAQEGDPASPGNPAVDPNEVLRLSEQDLIQMLAQADPATQAAAMAEFLTAASAGKTQETISPAIPENIESTITVNTTADAPDNNPGDGRCETAAGQCSLRAAIQESNANNIADLINLPDGVYIIGSQLDVTKPVSIKGASQAKTIVDGNFTTRVFRFGYNTGPHYMSDLTIRNARNKFTEQIERNGGGIYSQANLTLTNITVTNSQAFQGGGIYNEIYFTTDYKLHTLRLNNITLTLNGSLNTQPYWGGGGLFNGSALVADGLYITDNHAFQGGGIYNGSPYVKVTINNFKINNNTANFGAGIDNDLGSDVTLTNGEISNNVTSCCNPLTGDGSGGAGIYHNQGHMNLVNVILRNNIAHYGATVNQGSYGGAIVNIMTMNLYNVAMVGNQATFGAAIHNGNYTNWTNRLNLSNATLSGNTSIVGTKGFSSGGAIFNTDSGKVYLVNSAITQNTSMYTGGITNYTKNNTLIQMKNTILAGNTDDNNIGDCSGAIQSLGGNIINTTAGNKAVGYACAFSVSGSDQLGIIPLMGSLVFDTYLAHHPLLSGSQAIDRGLDDGCTATDINGLARPQGNACDVGPDEYMPGNILPQDKHIFLPIARK